MYPLFQFTEKGTEHLGQSQARVWASACLRPRFTELTAEVVDPLWKPCQCDRERHPSSPGRLGASLGEQDTGVGVVTRVRSLHIGLHATLPVHWFGCGFQLQKIPLPLVPIWVSLSDFSGSS